MRKQKDKLDLADEVILICPMLTISDEVKPPWIVQMTFKHVIAPLLFGQTWVAVVVIRLPTHLLSNWACELNNFSLAVAVSVNQKY